MHKKITQEEFERMTDEQKKRVIKRSVKEYVEWAKKERARYRRAYENWCKEHDCE